jgi:hypothetical protein
MVYGDRFERRMVSTLNKTCHYYIIILCKTVDTTHVKLTAHGHKGLRFAVEPKNLENINT